MWYTAEGSVIEEDEVFAYIMKAKMDPTQKTLFMVGTDSHRSGPRYKFITAVCVYKVGKGGNYFYTKTYEPKQQFVGNQKYRMFLEATKSLEMAQRIKDILGIDCEVHVDASHKGLKNFTSSFSDQIRGYVENMGYKCEIKPTSCVASHICDRICKQ